VSLQIDEQHGVAVLPEELRAADHRSAIVVYAMEQQDRGRARTCVDPPGRYAVAVARYRNVVRVEARRTCHRVVDGMAEYRADDPETCQGEGEPEGDERERSFH